MMTKEESRALRQQIMLDTLLTIAEAKRNGTVYCPRYSAVNRTWDRLVSLGLVREAFLYSDEERSKMLYAALALENTASAAWISGEKTQAARLIIESDRLRQKETLKTWVLTEEGEKTLRQEPVTIDLSNSRLFTVASREA